MKNNIKVKISMLLSAMAMMTFLVPAAVIASMVEAFPKTSISLIQMIITIPALISIPLGIVAAKLAKRFYKKQLVIFGTCCYLVGGLLPYFLHFSAEIILACSCIIGVGMGIAMTGLSALICEFFQGPERGAMLGLYAVFISIGGVVSALLGGVLGSSIWYNAFLAYLILIPILILEYILLPNGNLDKDEEKNGEMHTSKKMSKEVWLIALIGFVFYVCNNVYNNNAAMLVAERKLGGSVQSSYITTAYTFAGIIAGFFIGKIVARLNRKTIALACILGSIGLIIGFVGNSIVFICLGAFISGIGFCIFAATAPYHVSELSSQSTLTFGLAFLAAIVNLGQAFSPLIINIGTSTIAGTDVGTRFIVAGVCAAIMAVIAVIALKNKKELNTEHTQNAEAMH